MGQLSHTAGRVLGMFSAFRRFRGSIPTAFHLAARFSFFAIVGFTPGWLAVEIFYG